MGEYAVGVATRRRIYEVAKRLFYEKGVKKTSYNDICEAAEVNRGLIPYYFKSKNNIAAEVHEEFVVNMENAILSQWGDELSQPERNIMTELFEFRLLASDENICRFYSEVRTNDDFQESTLGVQAAVMEELVEGASIDISPEALRTVVVMVQGTETELVQAVRYDYLSEDIDTIVRRDIRCCYFLLGMELAQVDAWCDHAFSLAEGLTMTCDDSFQCKVVKAPAPDAGE